MTVKRCSECGQLKLISEFYKHTSAADGLRGKCKDCWRAQTSEYRARNPEEVQRWAREWARKNRGSQSRKQRRQGYRQTREELLAYKRRYRQENLEKLRERDRQYRENNRATRRAAGHRRRAAERNAKGQYTIEQWNAVKEFYSPEGKCLACGEVRELTVDHVIPLAKQGTNGPGNLQPLCLTCNMRKHTEMTDHRFDKGEFARSL